MGYPISCNALIENLLDILLDVTKLPLELCIKIDSYYEHSKKCDVCDGLLCYTHSKVANYYKEYYTKEDGYMCFNCCPNEYYITYTVDGEPVRMRELHLI